MSTFFVPDVQVSMTTKKISDNQIIEQIKNGNQQKYSLLVDRYSAMVFGIAKQYVSDQSTVEELAQEIFVKVYERISDFSFESRFSTWLYSVARNHCRDYAKNIRRKNMSLNQMEDEYEQQAGSTESPEEDFLRDEWCRILEEGLETITPEYAEAFLMKYRAGMPYGAMAEQLGASKTALRQRVFRAKKELKRFIQQHS